MQNREESRERDRDTVKITIEISRDQLNSILRHAVGLAKGIIAAIMGGRKDERAKRH